MSKNKNGTQTLSQLGLFGKAKHGDFANFSPNHNYK
jgi:hypothetical protein